jgi:flagellum-specific peptidoglycan hydrolase FlgJ
MNTSQRQFLDQATAEAVRASHPFPRMAACEAALESNYGLSELARDANNLFGMKIHRHNVYGEMALPTREFENGEWEQVPGVEWEKYPDIAACFADRLATLERLANVLPHYKAALDATSAAEYIAEVSKTWSTDPDRGKKCLSIYLDYNGGAAS